MPQQRLQFQRTDVTRSPRRTSTRSDTRNDPAPQLETAESSLALLASSTTTPTSARPKEKIRTSWVFRHMPDDEMQMKYYNRHTGLEEWRCAYCEKSYLTSGSTSGPARHLIDFHSIPDGSSRGVKVMNIQKSMEQAFAVAEANPAKRRRLDTDTIEQDKLEALWVRTIVSCNLSFRLVENPEFRAFINYLNEDAEPLLAGDQRQVRRWVLHQYECLKTTTKATLRKARSKIHISCDLWTSPNSLAILGITTQFIDVTGDLQSVVLALKEIDKDHTGKNLAPYVIDAIREYNIERNLGYFVMDNADNNDTMMEELSLILRRDFKIPYNAVHHRLRCQGHIINLAVKSFLFVTDKENIEEDEESNIYKVTIKEIEAWRKKGPLGKLHNFVVFLAQSTQRLYHFLELSHNHRIPRDNTTRWNSWFMLLSAYWNLRDVIEDFFDLYATADLKNDRLTDDEWGTIFTIKDFLEKLSMATKACESKQSTLDLVLPSIDYILAQFEKLKGVHKDNPIFSPMFNSGWAKMDKYYRLSDNTPVYVAALVLHPSRKWRYIEKH